MLSEKKNLFKLGTEKEIWDYSSKLTYLWAPQKVSEVTLWLKMSWKFYFGENDHR